MGTGSCCSREVLVVDDDSAYRDLYAQSLLRAGFRVSQAQSAEEALELMAKQLPDLVISDVRMAGMSGLELLKEARALYPAVPFLLVTAYAEVRAAVQALKLGAVDYLGKPVDLDGLVAAVADVLGIAGACSDFSDVVPADALVGVVAESPVMRSLFRDAYRVARSKVTVLLTGESGSGKEILARFIHGNSDRADRPIISINCAAIAPGLLASELFGHEKGAFTGALVRRSGLFRQADGGTLFLDEIGDMPLELQPALLRVLETGMVLPVGGSGDVSTSVRLIAATNRDLANRVSSGQFRQDLYYRLNVVALEIPPLRERSEDIIPLARMFLKKHGSPGARLSPAFERFLCTYSWPGNVRELAHAVERAALLSHADILLPESLPPAIRACASGIAADSQESVQQGLGSLEQTERAEILRTLEETSGNRTRAAQKLGISRRGLIYKLKRFNVTDQVI